VPGKQPAGVDELIDVVVWRRGFSLAAMENHIVRGDCLKVLRDVPDDSVDLIHTSPPYNISRPYATHSDDAHPVDYFAFIDEVIQELKRVLKPNGSLFWQTGYTDGDSDISGDLRPLDIETYGLFRTEPRMILWDRIIWRYLGSMAFKRKFTNRHETILWWVKVGRTGALPTFNLDDVRERSREYDPRNNFWGRNPGNVWEVDRVAFGSTAQTSHIAVFPEEVSSRIILSASNPGELVLDPFAGSGTTPKVAKLLGRRWLGIEIAQAYARESAIRVGFQSPGLPLTLLSGIVRSRVFINQPSIAPVEAVGETIRGWLREADLSGADRALALLMEAAEAGGKEKQGAWQRTDADAAAPEESEHPRIWEAVDLLTKDFRLLNEFNGVQQFQYALTAARELDVIVQKASDPAICTMLSEGEPLTFGAAEGGLALLNPGRTVRSYSPVGVQQLPRKLL
jgi:DNA modification methylase